MRSALRDGHLQGIQHQLRAEVMGHGPPDDAAAEGVEHHGEVEETRSRRHIGDVGDPEPVRCLGREHAIDEIGGGPRLPVRPRRDGAAAPVACPDEAGFPHQPGDPFAGVSLTLHPQIGLDARRA